MGDPRSVCLGAGSPSRWQSPACCPVQSPVLRLRAKLSAGRAFRVSSSWGTAQHRDVGRCTRCAACPPWAGRGREPRRPRQPELWGPVGRWMASSRDRVSRSPWPPLLLLCVADGSVSGGRSGLGGCWPPERCPAQHAAGKPRAPRLHTQGWGGAVSPSRASRLLLLHGTLGSGQHRWPARPCCGPGPAQRDS